MSLKNLVIFLVLIIAKKAIADNDENYNLCADSVYSNICVKLENKFYLIEGNATLNWFAAESFCRRQNGFLVTLQNAHEMSLISDYLILNNYFKGDNQFWIGNNDLGSEGIFYSIETGDVMTFSKWYKGEPNNGGGKGAENCVQLLKHDGVYSMNDATCEDKMHFICELKKKNISNVKSPKK